MKRTLGAFLLCILISNTAMATDATVKRKVAAMVKTYAGMIGCLMYCDPSNIVEYNIDDDDRKEFIALIGIDPECSGGTAMAQSGLILIKHDYKGRLFLQPEHSFPVAQPEGLPQCTYRLFLRSGKLMFSGEDFDKGDSPCCPSLSVEGLLTMKDGKWIVSNVEAKKKTKAAP